MLHKRVEADEKKGKQATQWIEYSCEIVIFVVSAVVVVVVVFAVVVVVRAVCRWLFILGLRHHQLRWLAALPPLPARTPHPPTQASQGQARDAAENLGSKCLGWPARR